MPAPESVSTLANEPPGVFAHSSTSATPELEPFLSGSLLANWSATMAAAESVADSGKRIHQSQLEKAMDEVGASKSVMQQSLFGEEQSSEDRLMHAVEAAELRWRKTAQAAIVLAGFAGLLGLIGLIVAVVR